MVDLIGRPATISAEVTCLCLIGVPECKRGQCNSIVIRLIAEILFLSLENLNCILKTLYGLDQVLEVLVRVTFFKSTLEQLKIGQGPEAQDVAFKEWSAAYGGEVVSRKLQTVLELVHEIGVGHVEEDELALVRHGPPDLILPITKQLSSNSFSLLLVH